MWCIPKVDKEFVARMEDVLELYAETPVAGECATCAWDLLTHAYEPADAEDDAA